MKAIFKREMKNYFNLPGGYVFLGIYLLLSGYIFVTGNILTMSSNITSYFMTMTLILLFLIPTITMKLFSEEAKMRTEQLLFTSPNSYWSIVMGKYFGAMGLFGVSLLFTLLYPFTLYLFGNPELFTIVGNYLGFALLGGALIAIGLFISSLTENQIISAILTYCLLFGLYLADGLKSLFPDSAVMTKIVSYIAVFGRLYIFQNGIFDLSVIVYYLSVIAVFLFLTVRVLEKRRYS